MIIINKLISIRMIAPGYHSFAVNITHGPEQGLFSGRIYCPFETTQHPEIETIQAQLCDYFAAKGALTPGTPEMKKFSKSLFAYLVGFTCPNDPIEKVLDVAIHVGWLFILDNRVDDKTSPFRLDPSSLLPLTEKLNEAVSLPFATEPSAIDIPSEFESYRSLININTEIGAKLLGKNPQTFLDSHGDYLQAIYSESVHRHSKEWMVPDAYKDLRKYTSAVKDVLDFISANMEAEVSNAVRKNIHHRAMGTHANLFVAYVNDLFSLNNEIAEDTRENIVRVIQYHKGCTLNDAILDTIDLINSASEAFLKSKTEFLATCSSKDLPVALKTVRYMESLMIGNLSWSKLTGRYKEAESA